jgi:hypothetical protein
MPDNSGNDKLYLIVIIAMIGAFVYLYQLKVTTQIVPNDIANCERCKKHHLLHVKTPKHIIEKKKEKKIRKNKKKKVSFKKIETVACDNESDISLESLNSNDRASHVSKPSKSSKNSNNPNNSNNDDNDSDISLDI